MVPLPWWLNGLVVVIGAGLGLLEARRVHRKGAGLDDALSHAPHLFLVPALLGVLLVAHFVLNGRADLWWMLPTWVEARYFAILWVAILAMFAFLFALGVALAYAERHAQRHLLALAVLGCVLAVETTIIRTQAPIFPDLNAERVVDGVVYQTSPVTCAAATSANLLRRMGLAQLGERDLAERLHTTGNGTTAGRVVEVLGDFGPTCAKTEDPDPDRLALPAMLMVDHALAGAESHAVALMDHGPPYEVWDPIDGRRLMSRAQLAAIWHGRAIVCP